MTAPSSKRRAAERRGRRAEALARLYMLLSGYWPLGRRIRTPVGEIDLIMRRGRTILFIEVKQRAHRDDGFWAVTPHQQRRLMAAAQWWLARHPAYARYTIRFDVIVVAGLWPRRIVNAIH